MRKIFRRINIYLELIGSIKGGNNGGILLLNNPGYKTIVKDLYNPESKPTKKEIFASYHYIKMIKEGIPAYFALGNSLWLTYCYCDSLLGGLTVSKKLRAALLQGSNVLLYRKLYEPQKAGKKFLMTYEDKICGPDLFYTDIVWPLGWSFYFGTFLAEMRLLLQKDIIFQDVMSHDFVKCPLMKKVRRKLKKKSDRINKLVKRKY